MHVRDARAMPKEPHLSINASVGIRTSMSSKLAQEHCGKCLAFDLIELSGVAESMLFLCRLQTALWNLEATQSSGLRISWKHARPSSDHSWMGCAWRSILYRCDRVHRDSYESSVLAHSDPSYTLYLPPILLELAHGEIVMMDNFTLTESMSAIEVCRYCFICCANCEKNDPCLPFRAIDHGSTARQRPCSIA